MNLDEGRSRSPRPALPSPTSSRLANSSNGRPGEDGDAGRHDGPVAERGVGPQEFGYQRDCVSREIDPPRHGFAIDSAAEKSERSGES